MNALTIIQTLMYSKADDTKLKTAINVLNELNEVKAKKALPYLTIRRAIKMQENIIKTM